MTKHRPLLRTIGIQKFFGPTVVLKGINFEVLPGQVHALIGENGAGKTTFLRILSGRYQPNAGYLEVDGATYRTLTAALAKRLGIGIVPQHVELVEDLSVADNIFLGRWPTRHGMVDRKRMWVESERVLRQVGVNMDPRAQVRDLTYVQKQMLEIARLCQFNPRIIILDEPTASLSVREINLLFDLIQGLRERGFGIVYVSHYLSEVGQISDQLTVLRDGKIVAGGLTSEFTTERMIRHMVGDVDDLYATQKFSPGDVVLEVQHGRSSVVRDLSFQLRTGEILGIAGPKGEGISEFLRSIFRISERLIAGKVFIRGKPRRICSAAHAFQLGLGYLSEERGRWGVIHGRSVRENISLSTLRDFSWYGGCLSLGREKMQVGQLAERFSVNAPSLEAEMDTLSGGNQQKVLLARLLHAQLPIYILDDPTFGVDVKSKSQINRLIQRELDAGTAILLHSSDLDELIHMSHRIILVKNGTVHCQFERGKIDLSGLEKHLEA